jgi:hypothetical protein
MSSSYLALYVTGTGMRIRKGRKKKDENFMDINGIILINSAIFLPNQRIVLG